MRRTLSLFVAWLAVLTRAAGEDGVSIPPPRPNILLILADDLGYSDLGGYGGEIATPNLDLLAARGLRFTQFYNTTRCWPTRAALLTGHYAQPIHRDKFPGTPGGGVIGKRPDWAPLLPQRLKEAGYRSSFTGKWHIDGKVLAGGFDESVEIRNSGNFFTARGTHRDDREVPPPADESGHYATIATADHAIDSLRRHAAEHPGKPFFHYLAFHAPHFPLHAMPGDIEVYRDRYLQGWDVMREERFARQLSMGLHTTPLSAMERDLGPPYPFPDAYAKLGPGEVTRPLPWADLTGEQHRFQATKMAIHAAMVHRLDLEIGRVIDQLRAMGALDNTLILFLSDNGASGEIMVRDGGHDPKAAPGSEKSYLCLGPGFATACNTPFRRHKSFVHEGGISTPLIMHWPKGIAARGQMRHTPGHVIDVVPTILELAGLPLPESSESSPSLPGRSLVPALAADVPVPRPHLWWLHEGHRAIRVEDWKLVANRDGPWELYDLKSDRAEQLDLAATQPERVKALSERWQKQTDEFLRLTKTTTPVPKPPTSSPTPEKEAP